MLLLWAFFAAWYAPGVLGSRIPVWEDTAAYFFANRAALHAIAHGAGFHWWDPVPMLGMPRLGNIQNGTFSPLSLFFYLLPTARVFAFFPALALGLLSSFTFGLFRTCGVGRIPALFGALSWATIGNVTTHLQHVSAIDTLLWLPATLLAWEGYRRSRGGPGRRAGLATLAGVCVAFQCFGALPQFVLYDGLVMAMWMGLGIVRTRRQGGPWLQDAAVAAGIAVIGIGLASWQLLPFLEMVEHSHRSLFAGTAGGAFAESFRAAPHEVALALARELFVWIDAPALRYGPAYVNLPNLSVLTVAFAVFAVVRRPRAWPEAAFALFFLLGMLGSAGGVVPLLTLVFPLAEQLRAPLRMIVPAAFFLSWLGAQGLDRWMAGGGPRPPAASGRRMAAGALAVAWVAGVGFALSQPRPVWMEPEAFRVPEVVRHAEPRIAADFRSSPRMPLFALDAGVAAGVPTLFLREPLIARSFFEAYFASQFGSLERRGLLARMGNVITLPFQKPSMPILRSFRLSSLIRYDDGRYRAVQLPGVVPRFRVVRQTILAAEPRQRWALAASDRWEPARVAIVEEAVDLPAGSEGELAPSRLRVLLDEPDRHLLEVESAGALVVTSGLFFPGWGVRVDDREARPLRVDLALRGVVVPPGVHRVEWRYRPPWIGAATAATLLAGITALAMPFALGRLEGRRSRG